MAGESPALCLQEIRAALSVPTLCCSNAVGHTRYIHHLKVPEQAPDLPSCPHTSEMARVSTGLEFVAQTGMQTPLASHFDGPTLSRFCVTAGMCCATCWLFLQGFLSHASEFTPFLSTMLTNSLSSLCQKPMNFPSPAIGSVGLWGHSAVSTNSWDLPPC